MAYSVSCPCLLCPQAAVEAPAAAPVLLDFTYNCMKYKTLASTGEVRYTFYSSAKSSPLLAAATHLAVPVAMPSKAARAALAKGKGSSEGCSGMELGGYPLIRLLRVGEGGLTTGVDKSGGKFGRLHLKQEGEDLYTITQATHQSGAVWTADRLELVESVVKSRKRPREAGGGAALRRSPRLANRAAV